MLSRLALAVTEAVCVARKWRSADPCRGIPKMDLEILAGKLHEATIIIGDIWRSPNDCDLEATFFGRYQPSVDLYLWTAVISRLPLL